MIDSALQALKSLVGSGIQGGKDKVQSAFSALKNEGIVRGVPSKFTEVSPGRFISTEFLAEQNKATPTPTPTSTPTATPTPTPTPYARFLTPKGTDLAQSDIANQVRAPFADDPETAVAIAIGESSMNPRARNTIPERNIDAIGLMQVNLPVHLDKVPGNTYEEKAENLMNPEINLQVARKIKDASRGWGPWEAFTAGMAKKHLVQP